MVRSFKKTQTSAEMQKKIDLKLKRKLGLNFYTRKGGQTTLAGSSAGDTSSSVVIKDHTPKPVQKRAPCPSPPPYRELCPLPKSQFLSTGSRVSKETQKDNTRLPPPDMEYLTRKPHPPLKWAPSSKGSSHVVSYGGHHDVFFIGTQQCEKEFRRSFMATIFGEQAASLVDKGDQTRSGRKGGKESSTEKGDLAEKGRNLTGKGSLTVNRKGHLTEKAHLTGKGGWTGDANKQGLNQTIEETNSSSKKAFESDKAAVFTTNPALKRGVVHGSPTGQSSVKRSRLAEVKESHYKGTDEMELRGSGCTSKISDNLSRGSGGGGEVLQSTSGLARSEVPSEASRSVQPPMTHESRNVDYGRGSNPLDYDTSIDMEILQDPAIMQDFMDDSDSSSDLDLPRVNVTGRYSKGKGKSKAEPSGGLGGPSSRGVSGAIKEETVWRGNSSTGTSGGGPSTSSRISSGPSTSSRISTGPSTSSSGPSGSSDLWGATGQGSSNVAERCPICLTSFPPGCTQYNADEHIAMCLAVNMDEDEFQ